MANPDSGNTDSGLGNKPPSFKRKPSAKQPPFNVRTANWGGLPGKTGPNRSAGIPKVKIHATSEGL
ncbi:MAG: hypothetical protein GY906_24360 [bacterium]|nr:hypothetical protein [bacterium]